MQPKGIVTTNKKFAEDTIKTALILGLVKETQSLISLNFDSDQDAREEILTALESHVFNSTQVEPYFAPFYSFVLSEGDNNGITDNVIWVDKYHNETGGRASNNPFNKDKLTHLYRWYMYTGMGWRDPLGVFHPYPYDRIKRKLHHIFKDKKKLMIKNFITNLGNTCSELDGGEIFIKNKSKNMDDNSISLGVSQALISLNEDKVITLFCPKDSDGLSIEKALPDLKGEIKSYRLSRVEFNLS